MAITAAHLTVPGFAWFFTSNDAFEPDQGPYRITSIGLGRSAPTVFIKPLGRETRRCVPFSRLELRPLIHVN